MLLLQRVVKRLRRRRRVKDPWLLLLRTAALLLLALAAAGPELALRGGIPDVGGSGRVVFVIDRSLSMSLQDKGSTLLQRAREEASAAVKSLPEGVLVGLVVFDDEALRLTPSLTADKDRIVSSIEALEVSAGTSNLREALLESRKLLAGEPGEIVLFSDEAGPRMISEASTEITRIVESGSAIIPRQIAGDPPRNIAVTSAKYGDGLEGGQVTVRVANYGPEGIEVPCEVTLPDGAKVPIFVDMPPLGEAEERITVPAEARGGIGEVRCDDPDLALDDARYFHLPRVGASRVLVVDGDPGDTPIRSEVYFLERALAPWGVRSGVTLDVTTPIGLQDLDPERHRVVFLANVADPRTFGPRLVDFVRKGGNLVISGGDQVTSERYNAAFSGLLPAPLRMARAISDPGEEGVPITLPDVELPLFAPFKRAGRSSFSRIRSHTVLTFDPYSDIEGEITTLLHYENGLPALVERKIGAGRLLIWTGTVDLGWSNLPLQSVFMPLVQRLVSWLGGESGAGAARIDGIVGRPVQVDLPDLAIQPDVIGPDGQLVRSRIDGTTLSFTPERPGAYHLEIEGAMPIAWVAVNTDPDESDVRPYDSVALVENKIAPELLVRKVDLAMPLLGACLALLLLQALIATRGTA